MNRKVSPVHNIIRRTGFRYVFGNFSANIGKRYAMFEAIHGSAPRMVAEGRDKYADPCSVLRAAVMLLEHIGEVDKAARLEKALDKCMYTEKKLVVTGRSDGATCAEFADYVMENL